MLGSVDQKLDLLRGVPLFADLDQRSLEAVSVLMHEVEMPAGQVLMLEGEPGETFYVIAEGTLRVERAGGTVRSMTAGGFLGEIALLEHGARTATATCVTDCRLLALEHHEFDRLMQTFPHLHRRIQTAIPRRRHGPGSNAGAGA
jgi:CRP/FNR family transcriptional regulator, cyclic AMP receptor protein